MRLGAKSGVEQAGLKRLLKKLRKLPEETVRPVQFAVEFGAKEILVEARTSMARTPRKGEVTRYREGMKVKHRPSQEGHPPAIDTRGLSDNVFVEMDADGLGASIGTNVLHGVYLELGELNRPWLFPAFESKRRKATKRIAAAVKKVLKDSGK